MKRNLCILTLLFALVLLTTVGGLACTSILVSPGASVDGTASITQTADCGACAFEMVKVPAKDWEPGTMRDILNLPQFTGGYQVREIAGEPTGNQIAQVPHTYGYLRSIFGMINEKQVAWEETTFGGRRELRNPAGWFDVTNLSMIAMERASTAREAVQIMGDLVVRYGYKDSGESVSLADPEEAWVFEVVGSGLGWEEGSDKPGGFWVARRVPDGHVAATANCAAIGEIDWEDKENFMYGPGIKEFAEEKGWYGEDFKWNRDFCGSVRPQYSYPRVWRIFSLVAPSLADSLDLHNLPFSVPVDEKLSLADIAAIHRDHYEGTEFESRYSLTAGPWNNPRRIDGFNFNVGEEEYAWHRTISLTRCEYSIITQSRSWLPDEIGACLWYGAAAPDTTCYVPFYASVTDVADTMNTEAGSRMDFTRDSYWWAIASVMNYADLKWSYMIQDINEMQDRYESQAMRAQSAVEAAALELFKADPAAARAFLTNYCNNNVVAVRDAWWGLLDKLIWKYSNGRLVEDGQIKRLGYPEEWLKRVIETDEPDYQMVE